MITFSKNSKSVPAPSYASTKLPLFLGMPAMDRTNTSSSSRQFNRNTSSSTLTGAPTARDRSRQGKIKYKLLLKDNIFHHSIDFFYI